MCDCLSLKQAHDYFSRPVSSRHPHPSPAAGPRQVRRPPERSRIISGVVSALCHVDESVNVRFVSLDVLVLNEPLDLFLDHFLLREEHVLQDLHQLGLQLSVCDLLTHLHYLNDGLLKCCSRRNKRIKSKVHCKNKPYFTVKLLKYPDKIYYSFSQVREFIVNYLTGHIFSLLLLIFFLLWVSCKQRTMQIISSG